MTTSDSPQPALLAPQPGASPAPDAHPAASSGLVVHRCSDSEQLAVALADQLATALEDPFTFELVCMPTPGVERWLSQTLSTRLGTTPAGADGICAGIDFACLDQVQNRTVREVLGLEPGADPWHGDRAVWALLRVGEASIGEEWFHPLRRALGPTSTHRYHHARRIVRLFARYAKDRPQLLSSWRAGRTVDPSGEPLDRFTAWQAHLWRGMRAEIGGLDPAERLTEVTRLLRDDPSLVALPPRLSVFGPTRLGHDQLGWLQALAEHRAVHLFLPHPSGTAWQRLRDQEFSAGPRRLDPTTQLPGNQLLTRLGRDSRELALTVATAPMTDRPLSEPPRPDTLLGSLQQSVIDDVDLRTRALGRTPDDSVHFHACHGPDRQVEVLREVVLGLLADDPTLEPRDIVVMCPDIETYAPLVQASFGLSGTDEPAHPAHRLRVRLADRSLRQANPLLNTLSRMLELTTGRAGRAEVLDLCADESVARRFGFGEKDLERLHELSRASGVRWGLDAQHRQLFSMSGFAQNTWAAGLQRMLLGITLSEDGLPHRGTVLPLDDIDSSDVELIGRVTEFCARLTRVVDSFSRPQPLGAWLEACRVALSTCTEVAPDQRWQLTHAWSELADIAEDAQLGGGQESTPGSGSSSNGDPRVQGEQTTAGEADGELMLSLNDLRGLLADSLAGRPGRANFRTGALTVCSMAPMRSVPHRVVCLLGLDDGVFPRRVHLDGDDLLAQDPWVGDRDPRSEDRQQLLDAVLSAREKLVVIYSGASPATGEARNPAVPLVELREAITDACAGSLPPARGDSGSNGVTPGLWSLEAGDEALLETRHPLQPFAQQNFRAPEPFSFDPVMGAAARATVADRRPALEPFAVAELPALPELTGEHRAVSLTELQAFFNHPVKTFLKRRGGIVMYDPSEADVDEIPTELNGLERWQVGDRALRAHLGGTPLADLRMAELLRGELPPSKLGESAWQGISSSVERISSSARPWLCEPATSQWVQTRIGDWEISGLVPGIRSNRWVGTIFSSLKGKNRLDAWLTLLTLKCARPDIAWEAILVGRDGEICKLGPVAESDARARLSELLGLYARGLREPLPIPANCGYELVLAARRGKPRHTNLAKWKYERDVWWSTVIGHWPADLFSIPASAEDTSGDSLRGPAKSRFEVLSHRIWNPLLDVQSAR